MATRTAMAGTATAVVLALLPCAAGAEAPRAIDPSVHGVPVELAPAERLRLDNETQAYIQGVAPTPKPTPTGTLDRVLTVAGRLPEPATWGLMILGFGGVAGAMRHRVRKSEAAFTARIRRIADGED